MEINVFGRIGEEISADWISSFLNYAEEDITVKINSYGGDVSEAHAIFNLLRDYKGKVTIEIIGMCASAATIIAMAGDIIKMKSNALFMIHETSIFLSDIVQTSDLSKIVESLSKMNETLIDVYSMRTKISKDEIRSMLNKETWMTAEEARIKGFIDEVIPIKDNKELKVECNNNAVYCGYSCNSTYDFYIFTGQYRERTIRASFRNIWTRDFVSYSNNDL